MADNTGDLTGNAGIRRFALKKKNEENEKRNNRQ
jgi:hypothetical protein